MSWLSFVWANLTRRKLRLVFTLLSIILAFLMFGMLDALRTSLLAGREPHRRGPPDLAEQGVDHRFLPACRTTRRRAPSRACSRWCT